jgi:dihydropteroate synthase
MGVINITPDSFSDGGRFLDPALAYAQAERLIAAGADIIDIGGESTRPGAAPVSEAEELARITPVLARLRNLPVPISVDTRRVAVMRAAIEGGAAMINDIEAITRCIVLASARRLRGVFDAHARPARHDANGTTLRRCSA